MTLFNLGTTNDDGTGDTLVNAGHTLNALLGSVISRTVDVGAATATRGNAYIVPASATGAWSGQDDDIAFYNGSAWVFVTPVAGTTVWVASDSQMVRFTTSWDVAASSDSSAASFSGALLAMSSNQSITGAAGETALVWATETYDIGGWFDSGTSTTRVVVPTGVTRVRLSGAVVQSSVTGEVSITFKKNGSTFAGQPNNDSDTTGGDSLNITTGVLEVVPGDYFEMFMAVDTTSNAVAEARTWFAIEAVESIANTGTPLGYASFTQVTGKTFTHSNETTLGSDEINEVDSDSGHAIIRQDGPRNYSRAYFSQTGLDANFDVVAVLDLQVPDDNNAQSGVYLGNSTSGKSVFVGLLWDNTINVKDFSGTTFNSETTSAQGGRVNHENARVWVRLVRTSDTLTVSTSYNGLTWWDTSLSYDLSAYVNSSGDLDQIGIAVDTPNVTEGQVTSVELIGLDLDGPQAVVRAGGSASGGSSATFRGFRVETNATQSISAATDTDVEFESTVFDTESGWDGTSEYTVPAALDGMYMSLWTTVSSNSSVRESWLITMLKNSAIMARHDSDSTSALNCSTGPFLVNTGDVLKVQLTSTSSATVRAANSFFSGLVH